MHQYLVSEEEDSVVPQWSVYKCTEIFKYGWTIMTDTQQLGQCNMGVCTVKQGDCRK